MADVARLAGVSQQTVSRVLNESPHVRADTRERVWRRSASSTTARTGWRARWSRGARARSASSSFDTTLYGPASTLLGIERAAHDAGYSSVDRQPALELTVVDVHRAIERLREQGVDGVLVIAPQEAAARALHGCAGLPVVATEAGTAGRHPVGRRRPGAGAAAATRHLLALGHRTVWHVSGPPDWLEAQDRVRGWRDDARRGAGAGARRCWWATGAPPGYELGAAGCPPTRPRSSSANDQMALGRAARAARARSPGPEEVSVVGFDDIPEAAYFTPPLTTVRQHFDEVGRQALLALVAQLDGAPPDRDADDDRSRARRPRQHRRRPTGSSSRA